MRLSGILLPPIPHRAHSLFSFFCKYEVYLLLLSHVDLPPVKMAEHPAHYAARSLA